MRWQKEPPTEPGVYWVREDWVADYDKLWRMVIHDRVPVLVSRRRDGKVVVYEPGIEGERQLSDFNYWYGPIDYPEFPKETETRVLMEGLAC